jgi:short-subunit dehydrogenase
MADPIAGRVVLVTGPARGIGAETARQLARLGARLSLVGMEPERLEALAAELGDGHAWFACDVTDQAAVDRAVAGTVERLGGIDVVVANAGIAANGTVAVAPVEALARTIDVNLTGVVRTVSATLPHVTARRGYYLLVSSAAALMPGPGLAVYAATKVGVEHFGAALRLEVAHKGVDVGVVHPCWIETDLVRDQRRDIATFERMLRSLPGPFGTVTSVEACAAAMVEAIRTRRWKTYVPRSLAPFAALRQLVAGPLGYGRLRRHAARFIPSLEREAATLGRPFGETSAGLARLAEPEAPEAEP